MNTTFGFADAVSANPFVKKSREANSHPNQLGLTFIVRISRNRKETRESELPVSAFEMRVGFGQVGDLHFFSVPFQSFPRELTGDYTKA